MIFRPGNSVGRRTGRLRPNSSVCAAACLLLCGVPAVADAAEPMQASVLPDLSGMVWIGGNRFLAVHDAKTIGEASDPRVSILTLPQNLNGIRFINVPVRFMGPKSNDLESAAWIPGTKEILMLESGDDLENPRFQRIFKARVDGNTVRVVDVVNWPEPIMNVEGSAVARLENGRYVFVYAERAQNQDSTEVRWANFDPERLRFGPFQSATLDAPDPVAYNRPLVAMDIDSDGQIFIASAYDAEAAMLPDPDNGPFASGVFWIGTVRADGERARIRLSTPELYGTLDGVKVESVTIREDDDGLQIFVGLDDENYGGTLRQLPPPR